MDSSTGTLQVLTGVDGVAARLGHRLTLVMQSWQGEVTWAGETPVAVAVSVDVASLKVDHGEGGVSPLTAPERVVARSNACKSLNAKRFPQITFTADTVDATADGYRLTGELEIHGRHREHVVDVTVTDRISCRSEVRQSDYGIKPYSLMMGSLRVADVVTVVFSASATDNLH
ncbi:YceI family protein [soil metagenome]